MTSRLLTNILVENFLNENPHLRSYLLKEAEFIKPLSNEELEGFDIHGDTGEVPGLSLQNQNVDIHKALTPAQLKKVKEPKKGGLVSALKKIGKYAAGSANTLSMLAIANFYDNESLNKNNNTAPVPVRVAAERIVSKGSPENKNEEEKKQLEKEIVNVVFEFERTPGFSEESSQQILDHEGFRGTPYQDNTQVSIGPGVYVSNMKLNKLLKKKDVIKKFKIGGKTKTKKIKFWQNNLYKTYNVPDSIAFKDEYGKIKEETGNHIFTIKKNAIDETFKKTAGYYEVFPERIQAALGDLAYNLGPYFIKKFKNFDFFMTQAALEITKGNIAAANIHLLSAGEELMDSKYAKDLPRRAKHNYDRITQPINLDYDAKLSVVIENKKYSLKKVFFS